MRKQDAKNLLDAAFREAAYVLGGIFEAHKVADGIAGQIMKHLEISHENSLSKLAAMGIGVTKLKSVRHSHAQHPAVITFLKKLKVRKHTRCES